VPLPLALYLVLRLSDLLLRGILPEALDGSWQSVLFVAEILIGGILPLVMLAAPQIRQSRDGLLTGAILILAGTISQRMSLSMFTMHQPPGMNYSPSLAETMVAFAIPAAAILVYLFFAEHLAIVQDDLPTPVPEASDAMNPLVLVNQGRPSRALFARWSGLATFVIALALPAMLQLPITKADQSVQRARGWETLIIDGDNSGYAVRFPHQEHQDRLTGELGGANACLTCHHLDKPEDEATACSECHTEYYQAQSIFDHARHQQVLGGNESCTECHAAEHVRLSSEICQNCHETMAPQKGNLKFNSFAPSYADAMHGTCLECHEQEAVKQEKPELALCSTCHTHRMISNPLGR